MAAKSTSTPALAAVTLNHENFESLLKMAHGNHALPSAAVAYTSIFHTSSLPPTDGL